MNELTSKAAVAAVSLVVGWAGNSLTLSGRVDAIEKSLVRIEARLYAEPAAPVGHVARAVP